MTFPIGLAAKIDNPVPASQATIPCHLNAFASKAATSAVIVGHFSIDLKFFIDRTCRASTLSFSVKLKLNSAFPFLLVTVGEGASEVD